MARALYASVDDSNQQRLQAAAAMRAHPSDSRFRNNFEAHHISKFKSQHYHDGTMGARVDTSLPLCSSAGRPKMAQRQCTLTTADDDLF